MNMFQKLCAIVTMAALLTLGLQGCASRTAKGAAIGAAGGAAAGALIGKAAGSTAKGAIIGAAAGGAAGAIIGRQMDQQAEELAKSLPNATVERVGEGILVTFESGILFDVDSDALRPAARENLRNLADSLQKYQSDQCAAGRAHRCDRLRVLQSGPLGAAGFRRGVASRIAGPDPSSRGDGRARGDRARGRK